MKKIVLAASLLLSSCAGTVMAQQTNCYPRDAVVEHLSDNFGETIQSMGIANNSLIEIFANEVTGSFTILVTTPTGPTCVVASGGSYQKLSKPIEPVVEGDPT